MDELYVYDEKILYRIYSESAQNRESIWQFYSDCLMKLHHTFKKAEETEMLFYVRQVISPVFPLVIKYFYCLYNLYCESTNDEEKLKILDDIEFSVVSFAEGCDALIQSINGSDWIQAQPSQMDGGGIRYGTPKLYAYYTAMLNGLADLFQQKDYREYGFCVCPALDSRPEAELLFSTIRERGKVGMIRVPGKDIADVRYLNKLLVHEFYHIVPGSELRLRKDRAEKYLQIIMYDIRNQIFEDVDKDEISPFIMGKLEKLFFGENLANISEELERIDGSDREYYSSDIQTRYANALIKCLKKILCKTTRDMFEAIYDENEFLNCITPYLKRMHHLEKAHRIINTNILDMLTNNYVIAICCFHMEIFREGYADISTILTLKADPESWFSAFRYYPVNKNDYKKNLNIYLRACLVCKVMTEECTLRVDNELFGVWKEWLEKLKENGSKSYFFEGIRNIFLYLENDKINEKLEEDAKSHKYGPNLVFSERKIWQYYLDYFLKCREKFLQKEYSGMDFNQFRDKYFLNGNMTNINLLNNISMRKWE